MKPKLFIGSSTESIDIAYAIQQNLIFDCETTVWNQGIFELSKTTIESLNKLLEQIDFGIFVFNPDDITKIRGVEYPSIRDNVIFELGLFIGKLGRERVFFVIPMGSDLHIPSDLSGITPGYYENDREDKNLEAATGVVCNQIRNLIKKIGPLYILDDDEGTENDISEEKEDSSEWIYDYINKNYASAIAKIGKKIKTSPEENTVNTQTWLHYLKFKIDDKIGLTELASIANEHKTNIELICLIARMYIWEDLTSNSIELLKTSLQTNKNNPDLNLALCECYNSNTDKAIEILEDKNLNQNVATAVKLSQLYKEKNQLEKAEKILNEIYITNPNNETILFNYSRILYDSNKNKESLYLLNKLTLKYPNNSNYWGNLSNCCLNLNLYDNSYRACKKADDLANSKQSWIISNIGNILNNKGFYTEAITWLKKSIEIEPDSDYAHDRLAKAIKNKQDEDLKFKSFIKEGENLLNLSKS